jgi:hypothetical protein
MLYEIYLSIFIELSSKSSFVIYVLLFRSYSSKKVQIKFKSSHNYVYDVN